MVLRVTWSPSAIHELVNLCGKPARVTLRNTFTLEGVSSKLQRNDSDRTSPFFVQLPGQPMLTATHEDDGAAFE